MQRDYQFDYSLLRKDIRAQYGTNDAFAEKIGMGRVSLSEKLNNKREWTQQEIARSLDALGKVLCDAPAYFFTLNVSLTKQ